MTEDSSLDCKQTSLIPSVDPEVADEDQRAPETDRSSQIVSCFVPRFRIWLVTKGRRQGGKKERFLFLRSRVTWTWWNDKTGQFPSCHPLKKASSLRSTAWGFLNFRSPCLFKSTKCLKMGILLAMIIPLSYLRFFRTRKPACQPPKHSTPCRHLIKKKTGRVPFDKGRDIKSNILEILKRRKFPFTPTKTQIQLWAIRLVEWGRQFTNDYSQNTSR